MSVEFIKTRIMLVDDHHIVRQGIALLLNLNNDMEVIGEAGCGQEAIGKLEVCKPHVVVMDLNMPKGGGLPAIQSIKRHNPHVKVIVLTSFSSVEQLDIVVEAGAEGFMIKESGGDNLADAIRAVMANRTYLDPVLSAQRNASFIANKHEQMAVQLLTSRERQIIYLIARGYSNQGIADQLFISLKTVKTHVTHILDKLQLEDRTQAAVYAIRQGWA